MRVMRICALRLSRWWFGCAGGMIGKWMDELGRKREPLSTGMAVRLINEAFAQGPRRINDSEAKATVNSRAATYVPALICVNRCLIVPSQLTSVLIANLTYLYSHSNCIALIRHTNGR